MVRESESVPRGSVRCGVARGIFGRMPLQRVRRPQESCRDGAQGVAPLREESLRESQKWSSVWTWECSMPLLEATVI